MIKRYEAAVYEADDNGGLQPIVGGLNTVVLYKDHEAEIESASKINRLSAIEIGRLMRDIDRSHNANEKLCDEIESARKESSDVKSMLTNSHKENKKLLAKVSEALDETISAQSLLIEEKIKQVARKKLMDKMLDILEWYFKTHCRYTSSIELAIKHQKIKSLIEQARKLKDV